MSDLSILCRRKPRLFCVELFSDIEHHNCHGYTTPRKASNVCHILLNEQTKILGSVKLHIGIGQFYGETQTLGGSVIGSVTLGPIFGELLPFFPFSVMANTNFPFPSTLGKPETQTFGGSVIGKNGCSSPQMRPRAKLPITDPSMGFSVSMNTRKTRDPNFREVGNWEFYSRTRFGELWPFCPFSVMANTNFPFPSTLGKPETQTLGGSVIGKNGCSSPQMRPRTKLPITDPSMGFSVSMNTQKTRDPNFREVGNWEFYSRTRFGELWPFCPFSVMADTNFPFPSTLRKPETQTLGGSVIGSFALRCICGELRPFFPFSVMANTNFPTLRKLE